jgi:uncharacterized protein YqgV (UPF0045/DUF77 family)
MHLDLLFHALRAGIKSWGAILVLSRDGWSARIYNVQYCIVAARIRNTMDIGIEISLYPLQADFGAVIHEFIERLNADGRLRVVSNSMSTQVFGPYQEVMATLQRELGTTFAGLEGTSGKAVFVMKVFGPLASA